MNRRMERARGGLGVCVALCGLGLAAATVSQDGARLTIDVPAGETFAYAEDLPAGVDEIRKTGAGTCDFGVTPYRTFTGAIWVEAGVLTGDPGVGTTGAFGTPGEIHVADGARFKIHNTWHNAGTAAFEGYTPGSQVATPLSATHLYVRGAGPDGTGAIWHQASLNSHNVFGNVTLEGDTTFYTEKRWGLGGAANVLDMGGHTLTLLGKGNEQFELGRPVTRVRAPGDVRLEGGGLLVEAGGNPDVPNAGGKPGLVMEDGTVGALAERTLFAAAGRIVSVFEAGCPLRIHGTGAEGGVVSLRLGYSGSRGHLLGKVTADPGVRMEVSYGHVKSKGGSLRGRVEVETLRVTNPTVSGTLKPSEGAFVPVLGGAGAGAVLTNLVVASEKLRLVDAGEVAIAGVTKGESWGPNVPMSGTMPVQIGLGNGNVNPACLSIEGATVLRAASDAPPGVLAPCYVRMLGTGSWDFALFEVKDGGVAYADFFTGSGSTQGAAVYLSGAGSKIISRGSWASRNWFGRTRGYATLDIRGGEHESGGFTCFGENGRGFFVQRGGVVRYGGDPLRLARRLGGYGHYIGLGGTFGAGPDGRTTQVDLGFCDAFTDSDGYTAAFTVGGTCTAEVTRVCAWMITNTSATATALVNLNGRGTLACAELRRQCQGASSAAEVEALQGRGDLGAAAFYVNFDGGTLRATRDNAAFFGAGPLVPDRVTVFTGGARLDTGGYAVAIASAFERPFGKGLAAVAFADGDTVPPIGTRRFRVTGAGAAAAVVTDFDAAARADAGNALVCCPGFGYGDDVTVELERTKNWAGVYDGTPAVTLVDFDAPGYVDGGLTKLGAGTLTLQGANTYAGATRVTSGTLAFTHAAGFPGGDLEFPAESLLSAAPPRLVAPSLAFRVGAKLRVTGAEALLETDALGFRTLVTVGTPLAALPPVEFADADGRAMTVPAAWTFRLSKDGTEVTFGYARGTLLLFR